MQTTEKMYQEYRSGLLEFLLKRLDYKQAAEGVLADIVVRIMTRQAYLPESENLCAWFYRITRNALIDYYRKKNIKKEVPEDMVFFINQNDKEMLEKNKAELSVCLRPLINSLPRKFKNALLLTEIKGITQTNAANLDNIALSDMKSIVNKGRLQMRDALVMCCQMEIDQNSKIVIDFGSPDTSGYC